MWLRSLGVVFAASALATAAAAQTATAQTPTTQTTATVFDCAFGAKRVLVQKTAQDLTYAFGPPGKPEMALRLPAGSGKVTYRSELFPRAINVQLRFRNGDVSYIVYHREYFGTATHAGAVDYDGLLVLRGGRLLANRVCTSGPGFSDVDLSALPGEPDDAFFIDSYVK